MEVIRSKNSPDEWIWLDHVHPRTDATMLVTAHAEFVSLEIARGADRATAYLEKETVAGLVAHLQAWLTTGTMVLPELPTEEG